VPTQSEATDRTVPETITAPSDPALPVSLSRVKMHLRTDISETDIENYLDNSLIAAATKRARGYTERTFLERTYELYFSEWPIGRTIKLPRPPVTTLNTFEYTDDNGDTSSVSSDKYDFSGRDHMGRIRLKTNKEWPDATLRALDPIKVEYVAGYGPSRDDVPEDIKLGIMEMVKGYWFDPEDVMAWGRQLLDPYQVHEV